MPSASAIHSPAEIVAQMLVDLGVATGPGGTGVWPVFSTGITDKPDDVIAVTDTSGMADGRPLLPGSDPEQHYGVQITVRGATHPRAWIKATAIRSALASVYLRTVHVGTGADHRDYTIPAVVKLDPIIVVGKDRPQSNRVLMTLNPMFAYHTSDE